MNIREYQDKVYEVRPKLYLFDVTLPGILSGVVFIVCLYQVLSSQVYVSMYSLVALVAAYTVINSFLTLSNPQKIVFENGTIQFKAFNQTHRYVISDIKSFNVREFPSGGLIYLRIDQKFPKGRYWIRTHKHEDGKELFQRILDLDYKLNPDSLKSYAKRTSVKAKNMRDKKKKGNDNV
jgi:hypothetical protein